MAAMKNKLSARPTIDTPSALTRGGVVLLKTFTSTRHPRLGDSPYRGTTLSRHHRVKRPVPFIWPSLISMKAEPTLMGTSRVGNSSQRLPPTKSRDRIPTAARCSARARRGAIGRRYHCRANPQARQALPNRSRRQQRRRDMDRSISTCAAAASPRSSRHPKTRSAHTPARNSCG